MIAVPSSEHKNPHGHETQRQHQGFDGYLSMGIPGHSVQRSSSYVVGCGSGQDDDNPQHITQQSNPSAASMTSCKDSSVDHLNPRLQPAQPPRCKCHTQIMDYGLWMMNYGVCFDAIYNKISRRTPAPHCGRIATSSKPNAGQQFYFQGYNVSRVESLLKFRLTRIRSLDQSFLNQSLFDVKER